MKSFLDANINQHRIFFSGKMSYPDPQLDQAYVNVPVGLVSEFKPRDKEPNGSKFKKFNFAKWKVPFFQVLIAAIYSFLFS